MEKKYPPPAQIVFETVLATPSTVKEAVIVPLAEIDCDSALTVTDVPVFPFG